MPGKRGGKRPGAGRKAKPQSAEEITRLAISQSLAREILEFAQLEHNPHQVTIKASEDPSKPATSKKCHCLLCLWRGILEDKDARVRLMAVDRLMNRAYGRAPRAPLAPEDKKGKLDPLSSNMRVIVEFIGRDQPDSEPA